MLDYGELSNELETLKQQMYYKRLNLSVQLMSISVLYYDYALTFLDEVEYIWRQPRKLTTLFYVFCRYSLIANPLYLVSVSTTSIDCNVGYILSGVLSIFGHLGVIAVWGLRTSAIYDKHKAVSISLGLLGTSVIVLLIVRAPFNQCQGAVKFQWLRGAIAALMLFYEVLAFLLAALRAWRTVRDDVKFWDNAKVSLNYVIFSQGLIYISAVFLLATLTIILNFQVNMIFTRLLNSVKAPLSGALTARFLIQLRKWERQRTSFNSKTTLPYYDPAVSTNIDFTGGGDVNEGTAQSSSLSVIQELGRDIGPKPRSMEELNGDGDEEGYEELELDVREERPPRHGKGRQVGNDDVLNESSSANTESSPVSALFSANGHLSRRNRVKVSENEGNGSEGSCSRVTLDAVRLSTVRADIKATGGGSKSARLE